jgi:predicted GIY-YIG superfamily endonuclease
MIAHPTKRLRTTPHQFGAVYRVYDSADALLYVGVTASPQRRILRHRRAAWWTQAAYIEWEFFVTYGTAVDAERDAILTESPMHNKTLGDE